MREKMGFDLFFLYFFYLEWDGFYLDVDSLYMWVLLLKCFGKIDVVLKKIEDVIDNLRRNVIMV